MPSSTAAVISTISTTNAAKTRVLRAAGTLMSRIDELLVSADIDAQLTRELEAALIDDIDSLSSMAYREHRDDAKKEFHAILYALNTAKIQPPWLSSRRNAGHHLFARIRNRLESAVEQHDRSQHAAALAAVPRNLDAFSPWIIQLIQTHPSNVTHPLFAFLRDEASFSQLREFFRQEAPMDLHFVDILLLMMPALHGPMKMELAGNFWDEMGCGKPHLVHRFKRQVQMRHLGIAEDDHLTHADDYCWEELALANLYFEGALNRSKLTQLIGNMLATETMVPGRVECQVKGWQRAGLPDEALEYLQDHTSIDVEHAQGWLNNLVMPLLRAHPELTSQLVFGALRRLQAAQNVCDVMLRRLPAF